MFSCGSPESASVITGSTKAGVPRSGSNAPRSGDGWTELLAFQKLKVTLMLNFAEKPHLELTFKKSDSTRRLPSGPLSSLETRSGCTMDGADVTDKRGNATNLPPGEIPSLQRNSTQFLCSGGGHVTASLLQSHGWAEEV